jgi:phage terminase large subunit GpA-like protein
MFDQPPTPELRELVRNITAGMRPPPRLSLSEWADTKRQLSSDTAAEPGRWRTSRFEPQRGVMDSITINQETVVMKAAQLGFTEIVLNTCGYFIEQDPSPILVVQPNIEPMAKDFSADRLAPMLRDTPCLRGIVGDAKSRDAKNTILNKTFTGGNISVTGANSPAGLRSKPKRIVAFDEVDGYGLSSGREGDPILLGKKRAANFWNRRFIYISTPTIKGLSRIEKLFEQSDKRYYHIPCPRCQAPHVLKWSNVKYDKSDPQTARFICPHCFGSYNNAEKNAAVRNARKILGFDPWIASDPDKSPGPLNPTGIAGFHISELYSSWRTLSEIVADFIRAKDDPEQLQVFINTVLGELWVDGGAPLDEHALLKRCEVWPNEVPDRVLMLTAGVDTHPDRLEVEVVGWAGGEESWSLDYRVFAGDPDIEEGQPGSPWQALTDYIRKSWAHPIYGDMAIEWTCLDTGGQNTQATYRYVKRHRGDRIYGVKGKGGEGIPIIGRGKKSGTGKKGRVPITLYTVGTDQAKAIIYRRLRLDSPGPGFCHFPLGRELDYFRQLTAEKVITTYIKGFPKRSFECPKDTRNEALDVRVYAFAAITLAGVDWSKLAFRMKQRAKPMPKRPRAESGPEEPDEEQHEAPATSEPEATPAHVVTVGGGEEVIVIDDAETQSEIGGVEESTEKTKGRRPKRRRPGRGYVSSW